MRRERESFIGNESSFISIIKQCIENGVKRVLQDISKILLYFKGLSRCKVIDFLLGISHCIFSVTYFLLGVSHCLSLIDLFFAYV